MSETFCFCEAFDFQVRKFVAIGGAGGVLLLLFVFVLNLYRRFRLAPGTFSGLGESLRFVYFKACLLAYELFYSAIGYNFSNLESF